MKKFIVLIITVIMIFSVLSVSVCAESNSTIVLETTEYFEDGSYSITVLTVNNETAVSKEISTKTGSKTTVFYNADNEKMVTVKLTASFSYTGSSATCTSVTPSYTIHDSHWRVTNSTGTKSVNKAIGEFTAKRYVLGIPTQTVDKTLTITCSNTGVLS